VSSKIAGETASLTNPALDRILDFAGEAGLVVILHSDVDTPFPKPGQEPYQAEQLGALFKRHPGTAIIWAHIGLGRVVHPIKDQLWIVERALANPALAHVHFDISWDEVAPKDQASYLTVYNMYAPLLAKLTPEARQKLLKGNYERLFDAARVKVRAWEASHVK